MDFSGVIPGLVGIVTSAALFALLALMTPSVRWTRRIKRDIEIMSGLPKGPEREQWQKRVLDRAKHLRLYEDHIPRWQRVVMWFFIAPGTLAVGLLIFDERQLQGLIAEGPSIIFLGVGGAIGAAMYIYSGILGLDLEGRTPEQLAEKKALVQRINGARDRRERP